MLVYQIPYRKFSNAETRFLNKYGIIVNQYERADGKPLTYLFNLSHDSDYNNDHITYFLENSVEVDIGTEEDNYYFHRGEYVYPLQFLKDEKYEITLYPFGPFDNYKIIQNSIMVLKNNYSPYFSTSLDEKTIDILGVGTVKQCSEIYKNLESLKIITNNIEMTWDYFSSFDENITLMLNLIKKKNK